MANTVDTLTPQEILRGLIDNTLTELEDDMVTSISSYKLYQRTALTRLKFPSYNGLVNDYALYGCTNLVTFDAERINGLGQYAFYNCSKLETLKNTEYITQIGNYALSGCSQLIGPLDLSSVQYMGNYSFNNCGITQSVLNMPNLQRIKANGFRNLKNVEYINTGTATFESNGTGMFYGCTALKGFAQHRTDYTTNDYFASEVWRDCPNLEYCDLGTFRGAGGSVFNGDTKLKLLIIRDSNNRNLASLNHFTGTPFASGGTGGTIYFRKSKFSYYKTATNWVTVLGYPNNMVLPIEGSWYQTHFADGQEVSGATYSDAKYFMESWGITSSNSAVPYTSKTTARGMGIALRGEHPIRRNAIDGEETHVYPIEIEENKTGVTITSSSLDLEVIELSWDGSDWVRNTSSGWLLQSGGDSHSYTFANQNTTHIVINARVAGDTGDTGTVTQAMTDAVTFAWNS